MAQFSEIACTFYMYLLYQVSSFCRWYPRLISFLFTSAGDGVVYPTRTIDLDSDGLLADRQRWMEEGDLENQTSNGTGTVLHCAAIRLRVFIISNALCDMRKLVPVFYPL